MDEVIKILRVTTTHFPLSVDDMPFVAGQKKPCGRCKFPTPVGGKCKRCGTITRAK